MIIQGQVQAPPTASATDGNNYPFIQGKQLDLIVSELHGKYYSQTVRGNCFHGATAAAGVTLPATNATALVFALWNPLGSGKNAVLIRLQVGYAATPVVAHSIVHCFKSGVGAQVATGGPITAATTATPNNGMLGLGTTSSMLFIPGTATLAAAGTILKSAGFSQVATTAASTTVPGWSFTEDLDGTIVIPPGAIWYPTATAAASVAQFISISWEEVPA